VATGILQHERGPSIGAAPKAALRHDTVPAAMRIYPNDIQIVLQPVRVHAAAALPLAPPGEIFDSAQGGDGRD